ncbi:MAG TPA: Lrp/AsnC family transcriptional regulator [Bacteroidia bacterium]|jgi:Lrp/AsnC family leucine-responsive transcriptional regulator|nr:Lrp/AsnC family transcriptional regulator [Bacteroidia bacterium]
MKSELDEIDKRILNIIQKNALQTVKETADKVGLSVSPTYDRIRRMERKGIISHYAAILNKAQIEKELIVFCGVSLKEHSQSNVIKFERTLSKFEEVMEIHCMGGKQDYLIKIVVKDVPAYHQFVMNKLSPIENIANLQSSFVMKEIKCETAFRLI